MTNKFDTQGNDYRAPKERNFTDSYVTGNNKLVMGRWSVHDWF